MESNITPEQNGHNQREERACDKEKKEIKRKKEPRDSKTRWKQPVTKKMTQKSTFRQKKTAFDKPVTK
jgi:hypothetical protein